MTKRIKTWHQLHIGLTVLCAGALLTLGAFYADGWIEFRKPKPQEDTEQNSDKAKPNEPEIRAVPVAEQFVEMLGDEAYCYEFEGTWIDCWIEVEMDGKTQRLGAGPAEQVRNVLESREERDEYADPPRGYVLWVIHKNGDKETWSVSVSVVNSEGEVLTSSRSRGIPAPQPDPRPRGFTLTRTSKHSFNGGQPVALVTQWLMADGEGTFEEKTKRKIQFMCRASKS